MISVTFLCLLTACTVYGNLVRERSESQAIEGTPFGLLCPNWHLVQRCFIFSSDSLAHQECKDDLKSCIQHLWSQIGGTEMGSKTEEALFTKRDFANVPISEELDSRRKSDIRHFDTLTQTDTGQNRRHLDHNDCSPPSVERAASDPGYIIAPAKDSSLTARSNTLKLLNSDSFASEKRGFTVLTPGVPIQNESPEDWVGASILNQPGKTVQGDFRNVNKKSTELNVDTPSNVIVTNTSITTVRGSCNHVINTTLIRIEGCAPMSILLTHCLGTCSSSSVPHWNRNRDELRQVEDCTCCMPTRFKYRRIVFRCPLRRRPVLISNLAFPFGCACRPCANVPEVTAQQPYDY